MTTSQRWKRAPFYPAARGSHLFNRDCKQCEIQGKNKFKAVIEDNNVFGNTESVSIATIDRVLKRNKCT